MKSLTSLWSCMAQEMAMRCCTSATLDSKTVECRTEHEGLSFLAITLADYGKAIEKWLDHGLVVPSDVSSFRKNRLTGLPLFLGGFLGRVFDPSSGVLLVDPDIEAIFALRELTLFFSKIASPDKPQGMSTGVVNPRREKRAMSEFVQCEQDVRRSDSLLDPSYMEDFKRIGRLLFGNLFSHMDRSIRWDGVVPKHGPGAVADRLSSNAKYDSLTWTARLEEVFPPELFLIPNDSFREHMEQGLNILEPGAEVPVRVITVPKTLKSPRIIAIEPTCMQYVQQGLLQVYRDALLEDSFLSRIIGDKDQEPNRQMACRGSLSGDLATLDLSEASDRVSFQHVLALVSDYPDLLRAVHATRSRKAEVPGHGVLRLAKYASMGSALCFPFESLVFTTLIFLGIERELSTPLSRKSMIDRFSEQVRVFGDDLIVPRDYVLSVVNELQTFGHVVNVDKSFWTGRFRESCGRAYFDGHDVSIVKIREVLPTRRQNASGVIATVSLRNQLYRAGLWKSAAWLDNYIGIILTDFPNVAPTSPLLGRESVLGYEFQRLHPSYFSPLTKGYYEVSKPPRDHLEGSGALLKCLLRNPWADLDLRSGPGQRTVVDDANVDEEHLERSGRPDAVIIKLGERSPF